MEITVTDQARKMLIGKLGKEEFLRVNITEGGCAGLTYGAEVSRTKNEGDMTVYQDGPLTIVTDRQSEPYLDGLVVDFSDDLLAGGLKFTNPRAKSTCGCGASFNLSGFPVVENGKCR